MVKHESELNAEHLAMALSEISLLRDRSVAAIKKLHVADHGACGWAWVTLRYNIRSNSRKFAKLLEGHGFRHDKYRGGWYLETSHLLGWQSVDAAMDLAHIFAQVFTTYGITATTSSRLD